jgi:hypothetical protein
MSRVKTPTEPQPATPKKSQSAFSGYRRVPMTPLKPPAFDPVKAIRRQRDQ